MENKNSLNIVPIHDIKKRNRDAGLYRGPVYFTLSNIDAFGETKKGKRGRGKYCMTTVNKTLSDNRVLRNKTRERIKNGLSNIEYAIIAKRGISFVPLLRCG